MCNSALPAKGLQVLVVDSDADSRELLMILLEEYGIETLTASCVQESLEIMQHTCPDLLISEIILPDADGYSLISQVKAIEATCRVHIPAIALTTCVQECDRTAALAAGFCRHLPKPIDLDALIETVLGVVKQASAMA